MTKAVQGALRGLDQWVVSTWRGKRGSGKLQACGASKGVGQGKFWECTRLSWRGEGTGHGDRVPVLV